MFGVYPLEITPDDAYRAPRLNHRKSKFGCRKCRARRVKCNEARPKCRNCQRHHAACIYDRTPSKDQGNDAGEMGDPAEDPAEDRDDPPESRERRLLEARLMHQYVAKTGPATAIDEATRSVIAEEIPRRSLGCDALLYAMYSLAALHQARCEDGDANWVLVHQRYLSMALREHKASLNGMGSESIDDICLTSGLLRVCAFATLQGRLRQPYTSPVEWFMLSGTASVVFDGAWSLVENKPDTIAHKFLQSARGKTDLFVDRKRDRLAHIMVREADDMVTEPWDSETEAAYEGALRYLCSVHAAVEDGVAGGDICRRLTIFPMYMERRLRELVHEGQPRALVVLAHYFALLVPYEHMWWIGSAPKQEVRAIADALAARWRRLLDLPLRVVDCG